jgi:hypothetical protein
MLRYLSFGSSAAIGAERQSRLGMVRVGFAAAKPSFAHRALAVAFAETGH